MMTIDVTGQRVFDAIKEVIFDQFPGDGETTEDLDDIKLTIVAEAIVGALVKCASENPIVSDQGR
jgi:hypothetical protein